MAYELIFKSTESSKLDSTLVARVNTENEIYIEIAFNDCPPSFICLDKETSIRLAKELRKQISFLED
jgi:hypothetical protein